MIRIRTTWLLLVFSLLALASQAAEPTETWGPLELLDRKIAEIASGYVYYVSLKGVTGAGHLDVSAVADAVPRIRAHVKVPVGVGFGIRDAQTARAVAQVSDAVVIGSRLVQILNEQASKQGGRETVAAAGKAFMAEIHRPSAGGCRRRRHRIEREIQSVKLRRRRNSICGQRPRGVQRVRVAAQIEVQIERTVHRQGRRLGWQEA